MTAANTNLHTRFHARRAAQKKLDTTFNKLIGDGNGMTAFIGDGYTGSQHMVCVTAKLCWHDHIDLQACKTTLPSKTKQALAQIRTRVDKVHSIPEWRTTAACSNCVQKFSNCYGNKGWKHCPNCKRYGMTSMNTRKHSLHLGRSMSRDLNAAKNMAIWVRHVLLFGRAQPSLTFVEDEPTFVTSDPLEDVWHWRRNVALQRSVAHVVLGMQATTYVSRRFCSYLTSYITCDTECNRTGGTLHVNRRFSRSEFKQSRCEACAQQRRSFSHILVYHLLHMLSCCWCAFSAVLSCFACILSFADPPSSRRLDLFSSSLRHFSSFFLCFTQSYHS